MADGDFLPEATPGGGAVPEAPQAAPTQQQTQEQSLPTGDDGFLPQFDEADRKPLENAPGDTFAQGTAKNAATGAIKGSSWLGGIGGTIRNAFERGAANVGSLFSDKTTEQLYKEYQDQDAKIEEALKSFGPLVAGRAVMPPTSEEIEQGIASKTGEYKPETPIGRIGQTAVAGGVAGMTLGGLGQMVTGMATGAGSAVAAEEAGKHIGPKAGIAAGLVTPLLTHGAITGTKLATQGLINPEAAAGRLLVKNSENPQAVAGTDPSIAQPGETTADITGDPKLAIAEGSAEKLDKEFKPKIKAQRMQQQQRQAGLVDSLADPNADPTIVSRTLQNQEDNLRDAHEDQVNRITQAATDAYKNAPQGGHIDELLQNAKQFAYQSGQTLKTGLNAIYKTIDPNGTMGIRPDDARAYALSETVGKTPVKENAAQPYLDRAASFPEMMPFKQLWDFDKELTGAITSTDNANALRQLKGLKGSVKESMNNAIDTQHRAEAAAVARGDLSPDDTLAARIERQQQQPSAVTSGGPDHSAVGEGSPQGQPAAGTTGDNAGPLGASGEAGRPGLMPLDPATAERLATANRGYGLYNRVYRSGSVGPAIKRTPFGDEFRNSSAPIFVPGDQGATNVREWMRANNSPEAIDNLKNIAAQRLRESVGDADTLSPQKLQAWKSKYANALRAVDEVSPGFSSSFDNAASATEAMGMAEKARDAFAAQRGKDALGKLMGLDDPNDIENAMGKMITAKNSAQQIKNLQARIGSDPDAWEGARRATANWINNNMVTMARDANGVPTMSNAQVTSLIRKNPGGINILFGPDGMKALNGLEEELGRSGRTRTFQTATVGSDTPSHLQQLYANLAAHREGSEAAGHTLDVMAALEVPHDPIRALEIWGGKLGLKYATKIANKLRMRGLTNTMDIYNRALLEPKFGIELAKKTLADKSTGESLSPLSAIQRAAIAEGAAQQGDENRREGRAAGGAVKMDHEEMGRRAIAHVHRIRKELSETTKPLLDVPDNNIAHALAIAKEAIG